MITKSIVVGAFLAVGIVGGVASATSIHSHSQVKHPMVKVVKLAPAMPRMSNEITVPVRTAGCPQVLCPTTPGQVSTGPPLP